MMAAVLFLLWARMVGALPDFESFPLGGGLADGIKVKITTTIDQAKEDLLKLEFTQPGGVEVAFRFAPKISDLKIERSSELNGVVEDVQEWGGFPTGLLTGEFVMDFVKTKYNWQVSVHNKRTPWFDFPVKTTGLITHVRLFAGFSNPRVILSQPLCLVPCDASECADAEGKSTCMKDGQVADAKECYSTLPLDASGIANCSTDTSTNFDGYNCCDGEPNPLDIATAAVGQWVEVLTNEQKVVSSCEAFNGDAASSCGALVGRAVRIDKVNAEALTLDCWAAPGVAQTFPYFALLPHTPIIKNIALSKAEMNSLRNDISYDLRLFKKTAGGVTENWFAVAMHEKAGVANSEPWVPVIQDRWDFWCDNDASTGINVIITDVDLDLVDYVADCTDLQISGGGAWEDRKGFSCAAHRSQNFCTLTGKETPAFVAAHSNRRKTFSKNEKYDMYAPKACCGCGGGSLGGNINQLPPSLAGKGDVQAQMAAQAFFQ